MIETSISDNPLVSIIMPAYNAGKFIGRAIGSVLSQTYNNIELIVCDDASTDETSKIVESFFDYRIIFCKNNINSGSAYLPRKMAFDLSKGEYIVNLDADDYIEENYVLKMFNRLRETNADVCCSKAVFIDERGNEFGEKHSMPPQGFDYSKVLSGREAFFCTVPEWKICMNGCLAKRKNWEYSFKRTYKNGKRGIHDDENASRYIVFNSKKVAFCDAKLYYTVNQMSVTHGINKNIFDWMITEKDLLKIARGDFEADSEEYRMVELNDYVAYSRALKQFAQNASSIDDKDIKYYFETFKVWHDRINWRAVKWYRGKIKYYVRKEYYIDFSLYVLRAGDFILIWRILKRILCNLKSKIQSSKRYRWYIYRRKRERILLNDIRKNYNNDIDETGICNCVVNLIDGSIHSGGLADRLRGIIGTYFVCKEKGLQFKLYFSFPFELNDYLVPSEYNWEIKKYEISKNLNNCKIIVLDATEDSKYQYRKQKRYLERRIKDNKKQIQVFTNAGFAYDLNYSDLFNELFKPSERLQNSINKQKSILGNDFLSVSSRFLNLLGDFNETYGYDNPLSDEDAEILIESVLERVRTLHSNHPRNKILVNSDSVKFLERAQELEYVYCIPGNITHIDNSQDNRNYEEYEKTFLDFFMIANAREIYLIKERRMHKSGYPYAASLIYNKPFNLIEF